MRIGCLSYLLPGGGIEEQWKAAAGLGIECMEFLVLPDMGFAAFSDQASEMRRKHGLSVCSMIGGHNLQDDANVPWFEAFVDLAGKLGSIALVTPEYAGRNPPAGFPPLPQPPRSEMQNVKARLKHLAVRARRANAQLAIEAINRYETRFARTLEEATALADEAGKEVGIVADFFHMNIEEADIESSIRRAGTRVLHVHLADSNRLLPGLGHEDLRGGFRALKAINYSRALSFECGLPNNDTALLATAAARIRDMWQET